jgi:hypothetical protein
MPKMDKLECFKKRALATLKMVYFRDIVSAVSENAFVSFLVPVLNTKHQSDVEIHRIPIPEAPVPATAAVQLSSVSSANAASVPRQKKSTPALVSAPVQVPSPAPPAATLSDDDDRDDSDNFVTLPPTRAISAAPLVPPIASAIVSAVETISAPPTTVAARMPSAKGSVLDPICIGISVRDPMYEIATAAVKQSIECEEARVLESKLDQLYKTESGRSRGWTKTHLTSFIVPRAAAGSKVAPKLAFQWASLRTDKQTSAALDFVCLAKGIRLAVWFEDTREIGIWPAADHSSAGSGCPPLFHISGSGQSVGTPRTVFVDGWTIRAALSVENSLEKLSLAELDNLAEQIGITSLTGKKPDRIRAIASHRTIQRLNAAHM